MKKYRVGTYMYNMPCKVFELEFERESKHFLFNGDHRCKKIANSHSYFDSFQDAVEFLREKQERRVEQCRVALKIAEESLQKIKSSPRLIKKD